MNRIYQLLTVMLSLTALTGCKKEGCMDVRADNYDRTAKYDDGSCIYVEYLEDVKREFVLNYANIALSTYQEALTKAETLEIAISDFIDNPTGPAFNECRQAWFRAREPYGQTEVFRFSSGPIDDENGIYDLLNAWPLDPSYIDYVAGNPTAGIINDTNTYPVITEGLLLSLNKYGGERNVSTGYHAIEFLLWGQDNQPPAAKQAGGRPFGNYLTVAGSASNQARRGEYLQICATLLVKHLGQMVDAWDTLKSGNYRAAFLAMNSDSAIKNVLTGMATLSKSEIAGKMMFDALSNPGQENEQSCFSDRTNYDILFATEGIQNIFNGIYNWTDKTKTSGRGLRHIIYEIDPDLMKEVDELCKTSMKQCGEIPAPFDFQVTIETVDGSDPVATAMRTLQDLGDKIVETASALGLSIDIP